MKTKPLTLADAAHSEERLLAECLMHPHAGLEEGRAVFVARCLQATGFQLSERSQRIHEVDRAASARYLFTAPTLSEAKMSPSKLLSQKRARKIAANPKKVRGFAELVRLAESYLVAIQIIEEQRTTIEVMGG